MNGLMTKLISVLLLSHVVWAIVSKLLCIEFSMTPHRCRRLIKTFHNETYS